MAYSQEICLTPNEYRFYAGAIIDAQVLKKDTSRLNSAVKTLIYTHSQDSLAIVNLNKVAALNGEKEAIHTRTINLLNDTVDKIKSKLFRSRRVAIIEGVIIVIEVAVIAVAIYSKASVK